MRLSETLISAETEKRLAQGSPVSCRKGCTHCCFQVIPVSAPEAFYLVDLLKLDTLSSDSNRDWKNRVTEQFQKNISKIKTGNMEEGGYFNQAQKYFSLQMPCPFLFENSCSIHASRPHACREQLVFSNPEDCKNINSNLIQVMHLPISIREALALVAAEVLGTIQEMIPMIHMFSWVKENQEAGSRTFDSKYLVDLLVKSITAQI
jgi:Fe-S-cluster containining protein